MVNDGCRSIADAVDERNLSGKEDVFLEQRPVYFPPQPFQDLHEICCRLARDGHAACHGGIKMVVGADETRENDLTSTVNGFGIRIAALHFG